MSDYPPLARFVTQRLNAEKRRVKKSTNPEDYTGVYASVAHAVVEKYSVLTESERRAVLDTLKADADRMTAGQMLQSVSRILKVKYIT
jgi:hypothetical protein